MSNQNSWIFDWLHHLPTRYFSLPFLRLVFDAAPNVLFDIENRNILTSVFCFFSNVAQPLRVWQQRQRAWCPVCWRLSHSAHASVWGKGPISFLWGSALSTEPCTLCTPSVWVNCVHLVLWFVCRYGGSCSLHFMPLILGWVVMQHSMCFGD